MNKDSSKHCLSQARHHGYKFKLNPSIIGSVFAAIVLAQTFCLTFRSETAFSTEWGSWGPMPQGDVFIFSFRELFRPVCPPGHFYPPDEIINGRWTPSKNLDMIRMACEKGRTVVAGSGINPTCPTVRFAQPCKWSNYYPCPDAPSMYWQELEICREFGYEQIGYRRILWQLDGVEVSRYCPVLGPPGSAPVYPPEWGGYGQAIAPKQPIIDMAKTCEKLGHEIRMLPAEPICDPIVPTEPIFDPIVPKTCDPPPPRVPPRTPNGGPGTGLAGPKLVGGLVITMGADLIVDCQRAGNGGRLPLDDLIIDPVVKPLCGAAAEAQRCMNMLYPVNPVTVGEAANTCSIKCWNKLVGNKGPSPDGRPCFNEWTPWYRLHPTLWWDRCKFTVRTRWW